MDLKLIVELVTAVTALVSTVIGGLQGLSEKGGDAKKDRKSLLDIVSGSNIPKADKQAIFLAFKKNQRFAALSLVSLGAVLCLVVFNSLEWKYRQGEKTRWMANWLRAKDLAPAHVNLQTQETTIDRKKVHAALSTLQLDGSYLEKLRITMIERVNQSQPSSSAAEESTDATDPQLYIIKSDAGPEDFAHLYEVMSSGILGHLEELGVSARELDLPLAP